MMKYEIRGDNLYDSHLHTIAKTSGGTIFDGNNQMVASIRGGELYDTEGRKLVTLRGSLIYDSKSEKIGSFADVQESIKGAVAGILHVALWYCFVR
jgi:hypothetical protein